MKFINKIKLKEKRIIKNKNLKRFLIFVTIFFIGIFFERFDVKIKFYKFNKELVNIISNRIFSISNNLDEIVIDLKHKNYQKILKERDLSIKKGRANEDLHNWVPANISFNDEYFKVKIKLKGAHSDHWAHPKKWSFKIKLLNDKSINGFKRFSVQQPITRDFLYEWLFMKVLKNEGLIYHRNDFLKIQINGDNLGIYYLEELYSKQLIENNGRREGPIISLDKNQWIEEVSNINNLGANFFEDSFWRAKIKPLQFKENQIGTTQEIYLKEAISLFENFRNKKLRLEKVFNLEQLAKLMAIKAVFGSPEFDWRDIKFYYNPITSLLEPIAREIDFYDIINKSPWWIDDDYLNKAFIEQNQFPNILNKDKNFYSLFLSELNKINKEEYLYTILKENEKEFDNLYKLLKKNFPGENIFSIDHFKKVRTFINNTLNPIQNVNAFLVSREENYILFSFQNLQSLPIEITDIKIGNNDKNFFDKKKIIDGKKYLKPPTTSLIKIKCGDKIICENFVNDDISFRYKILGQTNINSKKIEKIYKLEPSLKKKDYDINKLSKLSFISIDKEKKIINFSNKNININESIIIPKNYTVNFLPGSEIVFSKQGHIISYSSLNIIGTIEEPIIFKSNFDNNSNSKEIHYGYGILVMNSKNISYVDNVIFKNMHYPDIKLGYGLMGSVNFYNTNVNIQNTEFKDNLSGDDYLNIINSNFEIKNVKFVNSKFDSIDLDFSKGIMEDVYIINSGNDGIDFSGSEAELKNIFIEKVGDKGVSVGEKSQVLIENLNIKKTNIGIASKDLSTLNVQNMNIYESQIIAAAYQKKSEYGPGFIKIDNIFKENNTTNYLSEKNSKIIVNNELISTTSVDYSQF